MKRLFIGVKISPNKEVLNFYSKLKEKLKDDKIKWVSMENMHITLNFLGDTDIWSVPSINRKLRLVANRLEPFLVDIQGLGQFKKQRHTKVIWLGLSQTEKLNNLVNEIDMAMRDFGFESENRPFNSHLTLGRVKYLSNEEYVAQLIEKYRERPFQKLAVNEFFLIESIFQKSGSKYNVIEGITL